MRIQIDSPKLTDLVQLLEKKNLIPVIVFLTSRRACDEAVTAFQLANFQPIESSHKDKIQNLINSSSYDLNLIRRHQHYKILLKYAIASHHAGHIPAWKHIVEYLMSEGLLRGIFSTSTLAAGINMPARSVVSTASSLRSDDGFRDIKAFELAQMTGRAGRRGKDKVGFAIFIPGPFQDIRVVRQKLLQKPEPIVSTFNANYTMVLNLLHQLVADTARAVVERSLRQFQNLKLAEEIRPRLSRISSLLDKDSTICPAGDRISTYSKFKEFNKDSQRLRKQVKELRRMARYEVDGVLDDISNIEQKLTILTEQTNEFYCNHCPELKVCPSHVAETSRAVEDQQYLTDKLYQLEHGLWINFQDCVSILQHYDYLTSDWKLTRQGLWASELRVDNTLFIAELLQEGFFDVKSPQMLAALCGSLMTEEREFRVYGNNENLFIKSIKTAKKIGGAIYQIQQEHNLSCPIYIEIDGASVLWNWADANKDWASLLKLVDASEGDIVRLIFRTADLLGQLAGLHKFYPELGKLSRQAINLIRRSPVDDY